MGITSYPVAIPPIVLPVFILPLRVQTRECGYIETCLSSCNDGNNACVCALINCNNNKYAYGPIYNAVQ